MTLPRKRESGVYSITNIVTGKVYVGSCATHIPHRWAQHKSLLRKGIHTNAHLQSAWDKYGASAFLFEVVEAWEPELCCAMEQYWINLLRSDNRDFGYNMKPVCKSQLGFKHTEETKRMIAAHSSSWVRTPEHLAALRAGLKEYVDANGHPAKGSIRTEQHLNALRAANIGNQRGKKLKGIVRSEEFKAKLRKPKSAEHVAKLRLREVTDATRAKMSAAAKGRTRSEETRRKISAAKTGVIQSAETRAKRAESMRAAWERRRNANIDKEKMSGAPAA